MNIGEVVKTIKKDYPSISISRIRFLEKEGLIKPKRSTGGTRVFTLKDIDRILNILDLQENQYYSLKAIKNNLSKLLKCNKNLINIKGKTADKIGIFGKSEAIGCWATINLIN